MWKQFILTVLLLCGLLVLVSHHGHPFEPLDASDGLSLKCPACVHGKFAIQNAAAELSIETTHESIEIDLDGQPRTSESLPYGSRAPPLA